MVTEPLPSFSLLRFYFTFLFPFHFPTLDWFSLFFLALLLMILLDRAFTMEIGSHAHLRSASTENAERRRRKSLFFSFFSQASPKKIAWLPSISSCLLHSPMPSLSLAYLSKGRKYQMKNSEMISGIFSTNTINIVTYFSYDNKLFAVE